MAPKRNTKSAAIIARDYGCGVEILVWRTETGRREYQVGDWFSYDYQEAMAEAMKQYAQAIRKAA